MGPLDTCGSRDGGKRYPLSRDLRRTGRRRQIIRSGPIVLYFHDNLVHTDNVSGGTCQSENRITTPLVSLNFVRLFNPIVAEYHALLSLWMKVLTKSHCLIQVMVAESSILRDKKLANCGSGIIIGSSCAIQSYELCLWFTTVFPVFPNFCRLAAPCRRKTEFVAPMWQTP